MLDEGLEVLAGLWSGEPFDHHGEHYRVAGDPPEQVNADCDQRDYASRLLKVVSREL